MAQLKTTFAGLTLNNPIIISSSGLTNSLAKIQKLEEAGAGAVVLKSVFEEQINMQAGSMHGYGSPEADDYLGAYVRSHALNEHITLIEDVKKHCKIPVIASINCYSDSEWTDFARLMEEAGADALELNILSLQTSKDYTPGSFEQRHIDILRHIKKVVRIPVIMKLGSNLTNLENAGTGNDLLNKIPGVSANEGDIKVFGAGTPEIYINGRKVRDKSELDQLASDNIKSVEVVNNPGSRYDATVNAVIRIQTKKPQGEGFGFNNRFYAGYGYGWNVLDQYNFNYRKGGFDLSGMLYGKKGYTEDRKTITQKTLLDKTWIQDSYLCTQYDMKDISAMLSLNYQFNENHSLGARYDYDRTPERHETVDPMNTLVYQDDALYEESHTTGWRNTQETRHTLNVYYNGRVGDWTIDFNADGFWSDTKNPQEMQEQFTPAGGSLEKQTVTTKNLTDNTLYATKLVFGHPLWGGNLSFGGEYTYTNRDNSYMNVEGILDNNNSSIKENSTSAFLEYARSFGKLQAQLGVRYEHLSSDYYEDGKYMDEQSRTYDNVFPSISLNLPIGKVQTQLTYTGSIYRPSYWMLRSDIMYGNRYTYEGGNPLLRPSLINRLTLNVSYKWIYLNSRYIHGEDAITQLSRAYSEDDPTVSLYSFYNMYNSDKLYTTLTLSPTIGLWSPQFNFLLLQQWYKVETSNGTENFNNPILNFAWNNNFKLPLGISLDVDLGFDTPGDNENTKVEEWCWFANISLYKSFFKDRLSVQLKAYDLFNSYQAKSTIYSGNRLMTGKMEARRNIGITLRYKFNATKSKYKGTGAGDSQKNRM